MTTKTYDVMAASDLADGECRAATAGPWRILVVRVGDAFHAINNRCSHAAAPLSDGRVRGKLIICPVHGARFDVSTGKCVGGPYFPIPSFDVVVENGRVLVAVPDRPPDMTELPIALRI